jgi:hypothetical protein
VSVVRVHGGCLRSGGGGAVGALRTWSGEWSSGERRTGDGRKSRARGVWFYGASSEGRATWHCNGSG